ncbi:MAG: MazG nucleotide pyrophosphohydrolase domain-containing protein [Candidatus Dormibacteria bacterium]
MNEKQTEILGLLVEECAEVIQAISKASRFGLSSSYKEQTNKERLQQEIGDIVAIVFILTQRFPELLDEDALEKSIIRKIARLKKYVPSLADFEADLFPTDTEQGV